MTNSYRQILRSTSIIGGASVIYIVLGLLRMKVAALILGPSGVGLIGVFTNLVGTATTIASLGIGTVGTRQVAEASAAGNESGLAVVRKSLLIGTLLLAFLGGLGFWLLRDLIAGWVLLDPGLGNSIGWLSVAVALSVAAASQNALLNGMRRIGDIARISIGSALLSAVLGILSLKAFGSGGVIVFVIAAPLASFVLGHWYVAKLPKNRSSEAKFSEITRHLQAMGRLGFVFVLAGLAATTGQLIVRALVQRELGTDSLGHFQAAWAISMTYIGFVLSAMGTDYYPRLMAVVRDPNAVNRLVNEQTEVALLLATPVLLAMMGTAPWVIRWLYSSEFAPAADVLRWQIFGDLLKIISWPLGFILLAVGSGKLFLFAEWTAVSTFVAITAWLLPLSGINATGMGFFGMYVVLLSVVYLLAARKSRFRWSATVRHLIVASISLALITNAASSFSRIAGAITGLLAAAVFAGYAIINLAHSSEIGGRVGSVVRFARRLLTRVGVVRE